MYTNKNWLNWIVSIVFKTIRCRFIFVAPIPVGCVKCCLDFQTTNISFRPSLDSLKNLNYLTLWALEGYLSHFRDLKALETLGNLKAIWALKAIGHLKSTWILKALGHLGHLCTWTLKVLLHLDTWRTWFSRLKTLGSKSLTFITWKIHQAIQTKTLS